MSLVTINITSASKWRQVFAIIAKGDAARAVDVTPVTGETILISTLAWILTPGASYVLESLDAGGANPIVLMKSGALPVGTGAVTGSVSGLVFSDVGVISGPSGVTPVLSSEDIVATLTQTGSATVAATDASPGADSWTHILMDPPLVGQLSGKVRLLVTGGGAGVAEAGYVALTAASVAL
jgi:hypothetical protein